MILQEQIQQQQWESSFYLLYLASPFQISVWLHYQFVMQTEVSYLLLCSIWHVQTWENLFAIEQWFQLCLAVFLLLQWQNLAVEFSTFWFICTVLYGDALYLPRDIQSFYATLEACPRLALSWSPPAVTCVSNRWERGSGKSQKEDLLHWASYVHPFIAPRSKGTDFRNSQSLILSNSSTLSIPKSHFNIALILNNVIQNTVYKQTSGSFLFGLDQHHCTDQDILQTGAYKSTADWLRSD